MAFTKQKKNSGVALLYVIMALLAVSFIGVGLINISRSDVKSSIFMGTSESARSAVQSGFTATLDTIATREPTAQVEILKKFRLMFHADHIDSIKNNMDSLWIIGNDSTYVEIGNSGQKFRAQLESFDRSVYSTTIRVDGLGSGGSGASARGVYSLLGLTTTQTMVIKKDWSGQPGFSLGGGSQLWTHGEFRVDGDFYIKDANLVNFDGYFGGSIFNGNFILDTISNPAATVRIDNLGGKPIYFNKVAYFGVRPATTGSVDMYFMDKVGFEHGVLFKAWDYLGTKNTSYWNGPFEGVYNNSGSMNGWNQTAYHNGSLPADPAEITVSNLTVKRGLAPATGDLNIPESLGINMNPCEFDLDLSKIPAEYIHEWNNPSGTFTETVANQWYQDSTLLNGFLIIKLTSQMNVGDAGGKFTGKMIVLTNGQRMYVGGATVFDCDTTVKANFSVFNNNGGRLENFGGWDVLRGWILGETGSTNIFGGGPPYVKMIKGVVSTQKNVARIEWYPLSSTQAFIEFDSEVIDEIDQIAEGLVTTTECPDPPADTTWIDNPELEIDTTRDSPGIDPVFQSRQF